MSSKQNNPGYLWSVLTNKCPRCRQGDLYMEANPYKLKTCVNMHELCPVCGQPTEIEVGFYYGTAYVSYFISVVLAAFTCVLWWLTIGFSLKDSRFSWWLGFNSVLLVVVQPILMRLSRTLWLSWFVSYDPFWKEREIEKETIERIVPEQMGNW